MIESYPIVVLCGGEGNLPHYIKKDEEPKSMTKINGRPFIEHQLELFAKKGILKAILLVGEMGGAIESYLEDEFAGIKLSYIYDPPLGILPRGTGHTLLNAYHQLPSKFILTYGDNYIDSPWPDTYMRDPFALQPILMTVYKNEGKHFPSNVELDDSKRIISYNKYPDIPSHATRMKYTDCGLFYVNKTALCYKLRRDFADTLYELVTEGKVKVHITGIRPYDIGIPCGIHDLESYLTSKGGEV